MKLSIFILIVAGGLSSLGFLFVLMDGRKLRKKQREETE